MEKKKRGRPKKQTSQFEDFNKIDISESYVSLTIGIVVVIFVAVFVLVFLKQKGFQKVPTREISSQKIEEIEKSQKIGKTYTVEEGDDLKAISLKMYGSDVYYLEIAKANNIENVDVIEVGQILKIPSSFGQSKSLSTPVLGDTYTVGEDEDLWTIAVKAYGDGFRWTDIAKANNLEFPDFLPAGTVLKIPR